LKNTRKNEDEMNRVRMRYEEVRDAYYELLQHSQDDDHKHLEHLKAYAHAMARLLSCLLARPPRASGQDAHPWWELPVPIPI
jgi:hypothetical protein